MFKTYTSEHPFFWSASSHIASFMAGVLRDLDKEGNGVPGSYFKDPMNITEREERDAALTWHNELEATAASLERFVAQQKGGEATPETVAQAQDAILWIAAHLQDLWD